jgi:transposase
MKKCILNFLEIQGYKLHCIEEGEKELIVTVSKKNKKNVCLVCGSSRKISVHSQGKWRLKKHGHYQEKQIYLKVKRKRLICLKCRKVFSEELPHIPLRFRRTNNFIKQSLKYLANNSFNEVARVNQSSYSTLKKQLYDYVDPHQILKETINLLNKVDKIYLGFDGQSYRGQEMVLTITELKLKKIIAILPSEYKHDLIKFLNYLPLDLRLKVKGIAVDMTNKNKYVLEKYFPNAKIVIDHYHVVQYTIRSMQILRRTIQSARNKDINIKKILDKNSFKLTSYEKNKLIRYFMEYPEIKEAYFIKERIVNLYKLRSPRKAQHKFKIIVFDLLNSREDELRELGRTLKRWETKILNYFSCRITNAYTEGIHTKCKLIKRKSYGFRNVETYVRKLILGLLPISFILSYTHLMT